ARRPKDFRSLAIVFREPSDLAPALTIVKSLFRDGLLDTPLILWNEYKQLAAESRFTDMGCDAERALSPDAARGAGAGAGFGAWLALSAIYSSSSKEGALRAAEIKRRLSPLARRVAVLTNGLSTVVGSVARISRGRVASKLATTVDRLFVRSPFLGI